MTSALSSFEAALAESASIRDLNDYAIQKGVDISVRMFIVARMRGLERALRDAHARVDKAEQHAEAMTLYATHLNEKLREKK